MALGLAQAAVSNLGTSSTLTLTFGQNTKIGNCLVVGAGTTEAGSTTTVSGMTIGGAADHFAKGTSYRYSTDADCEIWVDYGLTVASTSLVITFGVANYNFAWAMEWGGIISGTPDQALSTGNQSNTWSTGASGTLAQPVEVVFGAVCTDNNSTIVPPTTGGWTELGVLGPQASNYQFAMGYQITSATTALTYNGTSGGATGYWAASLLSLKAAYPNFTKSRNINQAVQRAAVW